MTLALDLEAVLTGAGFADVPASPLQRAICRAASGLELRDILTPEECEQHFGCASAELHQHRPRRVVLICGIRGGKSLLSCCQAIAACLTADLSSLKLHEVPRYAIVAPVVDAAAATFRMLTGIIQGSRVLRGFAESETADSVTIRRPDGRRVEIVVVAAHRGGLSVRNRWLVGCTLEEVASFGSEAQGAVVNAEDILSAAETRLLPGCQAWLISSPFGPVGLLYDLYKRHFGKPTTTLVVHAPTRALNPTFPQSRIDEIAREDPDVAAREYGAEWVDAESAFLPSTLVDAAIRSAPAQRISKAFTAAMDPATRGNSWTLAVGWSETRHVSANIDAPTVQRVTIGAVWQWSGTRQAPLSPRETFKAIADVLRPYGCTRIYSDGWSLDALADHARAFGIEIVQHVGDRDAPYTRLRTLLSTALIELPPDPIMRQDLLGIRQRATASGVKIHLPKTPDGRHCDYAPSVALAATYAEKERPIKYEYTSAGDHRHPPARGGDKVDRYGRFHPDWGDDD